MKVDIISSFASIPFKGINRGEFFCEGSKVYRKINANEAFDFEESSFITSDILEKRISSCKVF